MADVVEKVLNTRIQLKYDSFSEWSTKNPTLRAGEVAIAYLTTAGAVAPAAGDTQHPILFKVGPGKFNDLPWASALAADVHSWAKKNEAEFTAWVKGLIEVTDIDAYSKGEVDAKLSANSTADKAHADSVAATAKSEAIAAANTYADNLIAGLDVTDTAVTGQYVSAVNEVDGKVVISRENLPVYTLATGSANGTVAFNGADVAVKGLGSAAYTNANAYDAAGAAATAKSEAIADAEGKINALKNGEVKANADAIAAINNTSTGILAQANAYADQAELDAIASAKSYTDGREVEIKKYADQAEADALKDAKAYTDAREIEIKKYADQAEADAKAYADDLKDAILGEGIKDTFDTLKEIQDWIEGPGVNATELSAAIAGEAKAREDADKAINDRIDALNITDGKVASAAMADKANSLTDAAKAEVKAVKVDNATNADVADSLTDNAKAEVKAVKVDNAVNADQLGGVAANLYATKAYADQAEADAIASANANTANVIKNYYTKTEADAAFMDATETGNAIDAKITALNLATTYEPIGAEGRAKAYADGLAKNYATAAQGAKADSALQSVEVGTGLKVSAKANNKQTIEIDPDVVFVFNCGNASTLID